MSEHTYVGGEVDLFARAQNWKRYWISRLRPHLGGCVLEAGAGIGTNTLLLRSGSERRWVCLEPDGQLVARLKENIARAPNVQACEVRTGFVSSLPRAEMFDTILYIDVLEHIENDRGEVEQAAEHLDRGGHLVVLAPAHQWLFSEFDRAIGHHRRYTARMLEALTPSALRLVKSFYLDSAGLLASAANRFLLSQSLPRPGQIQFWDNCLVPCSRVLDVLTGHRIGKTVVAVWTKEA